MKHLSILFSLLIFFHLSAKSQVKKERIKNVALGGGIDYNITHQITGYHIRAFIPTNSLIDFTPYFSNFNDPNKSIEQYYGLAIGCNVFSRNTFNISLNAIGEVNVWKNHLYYNNELSQKTTVLGNLGMSIKKEIYFVQLFADGFYNFHWGEFRTQAGICVTSNLLSKNNRDTGYPYVNKGNKKEKPFMKR